MKMKIPWGKMGFSRCTPFTVRCATKTGALANIIKTATLRESTSTPENITCDFVLFPICVLANVYSSMRRETEANCYFILSHIKQSKSKL